MLRYLAPACLLVCLTHRPAAAQLYPPPGPVPEEGPIGMAPPGSAQALVASWYARFLHRPMDFGANTWVNSLNAGHRPAHVLSAILSSREYYLLAGGTPPAFITALYQDLTGAPPLPQQLDYWMAQMRFQSRRDVAHQLLLFYSQSWQTPTPPPYHAYRPSMHYPHYPYYAR